MEQGDLQRVFNRVISGETVVIKFFDKRAFESCRAACVRKFGVYKQTLEQIGAGDSVEGKYFKCAWNGKEVVGTFSLSDATSKPNKPYSIISGEL